MAHIPDSSSRAYFFETLAVSSGAVGCTASAISSGEADRAVFGPVEGGAVRFRYDGSDPTASVGHLLAVGGSLVLNGTANLYQFRSIRAGSVDGNLPVTYER